MVISKNSQLGLMMDDKQFQLEFLMLMRDRLQHIIDFVDRASKRADNEGIITYDALREMKEEEGDDDLKAYWNEKEVSEVVNQRIGVEHGNFIDNENSKLYLICDGVDRCSKMVKIGDHFSTKAFDNVEYGKHTYLLGKDEMFRFICAQGAIKGIYWHRTKQRAFEFGFDLVDSGYYFDKDYEEEFNRVAKIITFVFLGDIDVVMLEKGRNNGKSKRDGKLTNTSNYTVYVVDSSWNQLIIRTEGFAVMGHFRLQPHGINNTQRKLIWIDAFEKHGYKRKPRASIIE